MSKLPRKPLQFGLGTLLLAVTIFGIWRGALGKALPDRLAAYQDQIKERPAYQRAQAAAAPAAS